MAVLLVEVFAKQIKEKGLSNLLRELSEFLQDNKDHSCALSEFENEMQNQTGDTYSQAKDLVNLLQSKIEIRKMMPWLQHGDTQKESGVSMRMYFVNNGKYKQLGETSHSDVGTKDYKKAKKNKRDSKDTHFYSEGVQNNHGHAERQFLNAHLETVVRKLREAQDHANNKGAVNRINAAVKLGLAFLGPHIAVYTSSSLCTECQGDYVKFKSILDNNGVNIPMVFFAHQGTNNGEPRFGIWTIQQGKYQPIGLTWDNHNHNHNHRLELEQQSGFKELAAFGNAVIQLLKNDPKNVFPTVFAPDVILIKHICYTHSDVVKNLRAFYNEVSLQLLAVWRNSIIEFLKLLKKKDEGAKDTRYFLDFGHIKNAPNSVLLTSLKKLTEYSNREPDQVLINKLIKATSLFEKEHLGPIGPAHACLEKRYKNNKV